jgi:hypothetical protein
MNPAFERFGREVNPAYSLSRKAVSAAASGRVFTSTAWAGQSRAE